MITYYYYDDDPGESTSEAYASGLSNEELGLRVELQTPLPWGEQIRFFKENQEKFQGILLDYRMDEKQIQENEDNKYFTSYTGISMAQAYRDFVSLVELKDIPIVLISAEKNLPLFKKDITGHDLIDLVIPKNFFEAESEATIQKTKELISLANGYKKISQSISLTNIDLESMLGIPENKVYDKVFVTLKEFYKKFDPNAFARFILNKIIAPPGLLLNEDWVAAKMGIAIEESGEAWNEFKTKILSSLLYNGVFSDFYKRYWKYKLDDWWEKEIDPEDFYENISAETRIQKLKLKTGINGLVVAKPIYPQYKDKFTVVCKLTKKPLDTQDGFAVAGESFEYWQEREYVSKYDYAIDPQGSYALDKKAIIIDPIDLKNVAKYKEKQKVK